MRRMQKIKKSTSHQQDISLWVRGKKKRGYYVTIHDFFSYIFISFLGSQKKLWGRVCLTSQVFICWPYNFLSYMSSLPSKDPWAFYVINAVKAKTLVLRDRDYIVKDSKIAIVDTFSGRVLEGRRFTDGLQQSIEAKEKLAVSEETQIAAKVTYQNLFRWVSDLHFFLHIFFCMKFG